MVEPTTARAMAFRVEDMEIEDRVEALEQWGAEQREARRVEQKPAKLTYKCRACRMAIFSHTIKEGDHLQVAYPELLQHVRCVAAPAPEPRVEPTGARCQRCDGLLGDPYFHECVFDEPEQPSSLVEQVRRDMDEGHGTAGAIRLAEAIDALAAEVETLGRSTNILTEAQLEQGRMIQTIKATSGTGFVNS